VVIDMIMEKDLTARRSRRIRDSPLQKAVVVVLQPTVEEM
jgi:hypothetical protein